jgi:hypothetical protein
MVCAAEPVLGTPATVEQTIECMPVPGRTTDELPAIDRLSGR